MILAVLFCIKLWLLGNVVIFIESLRGGGRKQEVALIVIVLLGVMLGFFHYVIFYFTTFNFTSKRGSDGQKHLRNLLPAMVSYGVLLVNTPFRLLLRTLVIVNGRNIDNLVEIMTTFLFVRSLLILIINLLLCFRLLIFSVKLVRLASTLTIGLLILLNF